MQERAPEVPDLTAARTLRDLLALGERATGSRQAALWLVAGVLARCSGQDGTAPGPSAGPHTGPRAGPSIDRPNLQALRCRLGEQVEVEVARRVESAARRCAAGEPLQYVLGSWSFRGLEVALDARVLIPRPETEQVVEHALAELAASAGRACPGEPMVVVDMGTGSGAIAMALAAEGPSRAGERELRVWATDASADALELAGENFRDLMASCPGSAPVELAEGSWFGALPAELAGRLALVVSNPPYVSEGEWEQLEPAVRDHEPRMALVAGEAGTEMIEAIVEKAGRWLAPWGALVVEIAPHQALFAAEAAHGAGFGEVEVLRDLAGRERVLVARA
ncbi:MAG: peptide chain release factor N(5)-glutamine methyltransferase [Acidimicrobiales bacterium]